MPKIKLLVVANKCAWPTWSKKITRLKTWFAPKLELDTTLVHTSFSSIPFVDYISGDEAQNKLGSLQGIDPEWYNRNVTIRSGGYDIVLFVLSKSDWKQSKARGWRTDANEGAVELHIGCNEKEEIKFPGFPRDDAFFQLARHEILHALFQLFRQKDTTHYYWDKGQIESARDYLSPNLDFRLGLLQRALSFFKRLLLEAEEVEKPQKSRMTDWAQAIQKFEGYFPGSKAYKNNNPGNLRYSKFEIDNDGYSIFPDYPTGWKALLYQLDLAVSGKSKVYTPEMTLREFFKVWAPATDNNHPENYAVFVARELGVSVETKIKSLA